jgi:hypothetical protein
MNAIAKPGLTEIEGAPEKVYENGPLKGYKQPVEGGYLYITTLTLGASATGSVSSTFVPTARG